MIDENKNDGRLWKLLGKQKINVEDLRAEYKVRAQRDIMLEFFL